MAGEALENPDWDASSYDQFGRFVSDHGAVIAGWLAAKAGEVILDAGCGDGVLTADIAKSGADISAIEQAPKMVTGARARGIEVREMDLLQMEDVALYDAIFSNAVLHWIEDWPELLTRFHRALKPTGRLVVECGGAGNIALICRAIAEVAARHGLETKAGPESYFTTERATGLLTGAGFRIERIELHPRPTPLAGGMRGWLSVFREPFFRQIKDRDARTALEDEVLALLEDDLLRSDGRWFADYVRLRFLAYKTG